MTARRPLVVVTGIVKELPVGDSVLGAVPATPYFIPSTDTLSIAANQQMLIGMSIKNDGFIQNAGFLVEVA